VLFTIVPALFERETSVIGSSDGTELAEK